MDSKGFNKLSIGGKLSVMTYGAAEEIECGKGRTVTLTYGNETLYEQAKRDPSVAGKTGDAFVTAILALKNNGLQSCRRALNGTTNDGPHGEPAWVEFTGGITRRIDHNQDGKIVTRQMFGATGETVQMEYFKEGKPCQGPNGEPGLLSSYASGAPFSEINYDEKGQPTSKKEFHKNGKPQTLIEYKEGELRDEKRFDESGVMRSHWIYRDDGSRRSEFYNEKGRLSDIKYDSTGHRLSDDARGRDVVVAAAVEEHAKNGALVSTEHYIDGAKVEGPRAKIKKPSRIKAAMARLKRD
jgi:antitoxin component YwqK of YwqJK toxin-antitoxin module